MSLPGDAGVHLRTPPQVSSQTPFGYDGSTDERRDRRKSRSLSSVTTREVTKLKAVRLLNRQTDGLIDWDLQKKDGLQTDKTEKEMTYFIESNTAQQQVSFHPAARTCQISCLL